MNFNKIILYTLWRSIEDGVPWSPVSVDAEAPGPPVHIFTSASDPDTCQS